ncbi:MAG: protein translocase subunit SecD [candidate division WOR-3 bacterium]
MKLDLRWRILIVVVILILSLYQLYYTFRYYTLSDKDKLSMTYEQINSLRNRSLHLGLDLQGGMNLILEVDKTSLSKEEADGAVDRALEILKNRIDQFGVTEPLVEKQGNDRISIQLPGVVDRERAKNLIGKTAQLEFRIVAENTVVQKVFENIDKKLEEMKDTVRISTLVDNNGVDFIVYPENISLVKNILSKEEIKNLIPSDYIFMWGKEKNKDGVNQTILYLVEKNPVLKGDAILDARAAIGTSDNPYGVKVELTMNKNAKNKWASITGSNIGRRIAFSLDSVIVSAPVVRERIPSGNTEISMGNATINDAKDLAVILKAGALPAPVRIIEERSVGPTLGGDSIRKGIRSLIYGVIVVFVFMAIYYGLSGMIADFAMVLNLIILLAVLSLFRATLTLPGMAGLVLLVGTAIDANVLIFERIREELASGKTIKTAISAGYSKAFSTIFDANLTSLVTALILYWFGTGPIKGFAVTLGLGLVINFFSAIFVTRVIFDLITSNPNFKKLSI